MPALQLLLQRSGTIRFDATLGQHVPDAVPRGLFVAGRANGCFDFHARSRMAPAAGEQAARHAASTADASMTSEYSAPRDTHSHSHAAPLFPSRAGKEFVDLDEDLTLADLANAARKVSTASSC